MCLFGNRKAPTYEIPKQPPSPEPIIPMKESEVEMPLLGDDSAVNKKKKEVTSRASGVTKYTPNVTGLGIPRI